MGTMTTTYPLVNDLMRDTVLGIVPEAPLGVALRMMVSRRIRHLPVVSAGACVGVLRESDALWALWAGREEQAAPGGSGRVAGLLRPPVVRPDDTVAAAAAEMARADVDVVLVAEQGRLTGILTATDVVRAMAEGVRDARM